MSCLPPGKFPPLREVGHDGYIYLVDPRVILTPLDYIKLSKKTTPRSDLTRIATKLGVKIHTPDVDLYRGEILRILKSLNVTEPIKTRYTTKRVVTKPRDFNVNVLRNNVNNVNDANNLRNNLRNDANNLRNNVNNNVVNIRNNANNGGPVRVAVPGNGRVALKMPEVEKEMPKVPVKPKMPEVEKEMPKVPGKPKMPEVEKKNNREKEMPKVPGKPKMSEVEKKNKDSLNNIRKSLLENTASLRNNIVRMRTQVVDDKKI